MLSTLFLIVVVLLAVGVLLWGLQRLTFLDGNVRQFIYVIVIVAAAIWAIWTLYKLFAGGV